MSKRLKVWTSLGLAAISTATVVEAAMLNPSPRMLGTGGFQLIADGEGGGEGGGGSPVVSGTLSSNQYSLGSSDPDAYKFDAAPQIKAYADLAFESYAASAGSAAEMRKVIIAFLEKPDETNLAAARKAWTEARVDYLRTETFRFYDGPIETVEGEVNAWPLNEAAIDYVEGKPDAGIINTATANLDAEALVALNQKQDEKDVTVGWHAIEFLLWGQDASATGPGNRPASDYVPGQGNNDRRRAYLQAATDALARTLHGLIHQWEPGSKTNYRANFEALPQREALGRMVNGMAILAGYEMMSERMGVALDSGDQEDEQSCFSDTTKQDFVADLEGIKQVWTGKSSGKSRAGLDELVKSQKPELAAEVDKLMADAETKIAALGNPWDQVLASAKDSPQRKAAEDAVTSLQALADGLKKVGNTLGVIVLIPSE